MKVTRPEKAKETEADRRMIDKAKQEIVEEMITALVKKLGSFEKKIDDPRRARPI